MLPGSSAEHIGAPVRFRRSDDHRLLRDVPRAEQRIAAVLQRTGSLQSASVPISQEDLGLMANASRKQVNAAIAKFAARGWVRHTYRAIEVVDGDALLGFALSKR